MEEVKNTYVVVLGDISNSMKSCRDATLNGINKKFAVIRKDAEEPGVQTYVSYYTFNHKLHPQFKLRPVNFLEDLTEYKIDGDTAFYDAVGQVIHDLKEETDYRNPNNCYVFIIWSDGKERCSKIYTQEDIAKMIKELQDTDRWTFTYLGANQNLGKVAKDLNLYHGNIANYESTARGTACAMEESSMKLKGFLSARRRGTTSVKSFHSDDGKIADYTTVTKEDLDLGGKPKSINNPKKYDGGYLGSVIQDSKSNPQLWNENKNK